MQSPGLILAISIFAFLALAYIYFPESIDDAYITLRFARNLILGNGPVFNPGERVEGYSNFSWMLLLAAFGRAGLSMATAMKYLGLASGLGVLALVWKISVNCFKNQLAISMPVILLGCASFFAVWAVDGLETMFYTMLLTALVYALIADKTNTLLIGLIAGLVALTRPEGIMFALIAICFVTWNKGYRSGFIALGLVTLFAGGYEVFRVYYFGEFVSNTALAKVHIGLHRAWSGIRYLLSYNAASGYLILPAALIGTLSARKDPRLLVPLVFVLAQIVFLLVSGGDYMYAYRFMIPVLPCIALLCASAVEILQERAKQKVVLLACVAIAASQAVFQYSALPAKHLGFDNLSYRSATLFDIADFLAPRSRPEDWILLSEAGIIPFVVNARIMDYYGLVSPFNAVFKSGNSLDSDYVFSVRPKFVVISFIETENGSVYTRKWMEPGLLKNPGFAAYRNIRNFDVPRGTSFLNELYYKYSPPNTRRVYFSVFERTDSP